MALHCCSALWRFDKQKEFRALLGRPTGYVCRRAIRAKGIQHVVPFLFGVGVKSGICYTLRNLRGLWRGRHQGIWRGSLRYALNFLFCEGHNPKDSR